MDRDHGGSWSWILITTNYLYREHANSHILPILAIQLPLHLSLMLPSSLSDILLSINTLNIDTPLHLFISLLISVVNIVIWLMCSVTHVLGEGSLTCDSLWGFCTPPPPRCTTVTVLVCWSLLTPGRGAVHWGPAGRQRRHLKEVEHLCSSKSSHRELGLLYGPESPAAQPLVAGDTFKQFTLFSQATVLLYRLTEWNYTLLTLMEGTASKLSLKSVSNSSANSSSKSATWEREHKYKTIIFTFLLEEAESWLLKMILMMCTCSIKAALASLTSCRSSGSSEWSRGLFSNIRPSSPTDLSFQISFWLVNRSTTPVKFLPLPTGIYKTRVMRQMKFKDIHSLGFIFTHTLLQFECCFKSLLFLSPYNFLLMFTSVWKKNMVRKTKISITWSHMISGVLNEVTKNPGYPVSCGTIDTT